MRPTTTQSPAGARQQYLSFRLGGLEYGLDFRRVQELRPLHALERFSSAGEIIGGVALSRGVIMPIVDMRAAFGGTSGPPDPLTDVIILQLSHCVMGMVVDGVTDIVSLSSDEIAAIPGADRAGEADYLLGMGEVEGRRLILIDIDKLMSVRKASLGSQHTA